ncbi:MAG: ABC transporter ATP-binding protein [Deltaproteobacteria bacterium]|nr:ABC transporter ATP-binding protein [Deltaproteobacteria bacterium]
MIELRKVSKTYRAGDSEVFALRDIDLEIEKGEFISIMGPSGSGKSTLMNVLGCLDRPTAGGYMLNGVLVSGMDEDSLAAVRNKNIGFVFQTFNLLSRHTALENVELPLLYAGGNAAREAAGRALEAVSLGHRVRHMPSELSGGERQRVAIARAIVNEPSIILADEPTGNLDSRTGMEIMEIFKKLNSSGTTVLIVTHDRDVAANSRRIVMMKDGRTAG